MKSIKIQCIGGRRSSSAFTAFVENSYYWPIVGQIGLCCNTDKFSQKKSFYVLTQTTSANEFHATATRFQRPPMKPNRVNGLCL